MMYNNETFSVLLWSVKRFQNGILAPRAKKGACLKQTFEIIITIIQLFNCKCLTQ